MTCGHCTACCTELNIPELDKPAGVPCRNLTSQGCGIYDDRPETCREFECVYKSIEMAPRMRPDRAGFMMTRQWTKYGDSLVMFVIDEPVNPKSKKNARQLAKKLRTPILWRQPNGHRALADGNGTGDS